MPYNDVRSIAIDANGNKWFGTNGGGVAVFNENGIVSGINKLNIKDLEMNIYPNPANTSFEITTKNNQMIKEVTLYTIDGKM